VDDSAAAKLLAGDAVFVRATICEAPESTLHPGLKRAEPSATANGFWIDVGVGRFKYQIWVTSSALEPAT
jgi:hypothetical protein